MINDRETQTNMQSAKTATLSLWASYGICLAISAVFFFLFGFNSPIYTFNSDIDYNWFMTMGHGLVAGKIPYRDLFEQKGPIIYFVTAFCCRFPHPGFVCTLHLPDDPEFVFLLYIPHRQQTSNPFL